jgi:hypothetical protein
MTMQNLELPEVYVFLRCICPQSGSIRIQVSFGAWSNSALVASTPKKTGLVVFYIREDHWFV